MPAGRATPSKASLRLRRRLRGRAEATTDRQQAKDSCVLSGHLCVSGPPLNFTRAEKFNSALTNNACPSISVAPQLRLSFFPFIYATADFRGDVGVIISRADCRGQCSPHMPRGQHERFRRVPLALNSIGTLRHRTDACRRQIGADRGNDDKRGANRRSASSAAGSLFGADSASKTIRCRPPRIV